MFTQTIHSLFSVLVIIFNRVLVPIGIFFALGVFVRYFSPAGLHASLPAANMAPPDPKYADEDGKFGSRYLVVQIFIVVVGIFFALSTDRALVRLNRYIGALDGPADFRIWPSWAMWWFLAGFGAVTLAWPIVLQFWADFISRPAANSFNYWWAQSVGYDTTRAVERLALFLTAPIGIFTLLALPTHVSLRKNDIRDCGLAIVPCKVFVYSDARRITLFDAVVNRDGEVVRGAGILIDFKDGRRWSSTEIGDDSDSVDPALLEVLKRKIHVQLHHARSEADIPPLDLGA
jgi:hypothetical protein